MLGINPDKVAHIIFKARMFDAKEADSDPDSGSDGVDDGMVDVLEDQPGDATLDELVQYIRSLNEEEQVNLVALAWVGRGTYDATEWIEALAEARHAHNARTAEYLTKLPLLGDYLDEGLSAVGESSEAFASRI